MQVLREYKGNNASAKNSALMGKSKGEEEDCSVVLLKVIPYPTLLFESRHGGIWWCVADNLLYPLKALKKYKTADIKSCEPVVCLSSVQQPMNESSSVVYVGNSLESQENAMMPMQTQVV